jgi:hypothetical protein
MRRLSTPRSLFLLIALTLLLLGAPGLALASGNAGVIPPNARATYPNGEGKTRVHGKTYGQWAAAWWQWIISIPADVNPNLDTTGANCHQGQTGKVFFLAGAFGGTFVRSCTVAPGTHLFFPILNQGYIFEPTKTVEQGEFCAPFLGNRTLIEQCARDYANNIMNHATNLTVEIDGRQLTNLSRQRVQAPVFTVRTPSNPVFLDPSTTFDLAIDDGYYIMLAPLPPGQHTIRFTGAIELAGGPPPEFELDVTYNLTVTPWAR